jgi:multiple sugar transport system permease protein
MKRLLHRWTNYGPEKLTPKPRPTRLLKKCSRCFKDDGNIYLRTLHRLLSRERREMIWGLACVAPALVGFFLWQIGPILGSLLIAFTDWTVANTPHWIGLSNFGRMFLADPLFYKSLSVTGIYAAVSVSLNLSFALVLALLLNQKIFGLTFFRTIFYLPSTVPAIASSVLWLWLFNPEFGLFNSMLSGLGLPKQQWIYDENSVLASLILMNLWTVGPLMVIFLAGLQTIPKYLYEAVNVDGGNAWHKFRHITLPLLTPTILFNLILSIIDTFQVFTQPYVMTQGGPNNASLLYVLYLYRKAFQEYDMGYASALAWVLFLIIATISFVVLQTSRRWVFYVGGSE